MNSFTAVVDVMKNFVRAMIWNSIQLVMISKRKIKCSPSRSCRWIMRQQSKCLQKHHCHRQYHHHVHPHHRHQDHHDSHNTRLEERKDHQNHHIFQPFHRHCQPVPPLKPKQSLPIQKQKTKCPLICHSMSKNWK